MTLDQLGLLYKTDKASSHHGYCQHYEKLFSDYRQFPITLLEIGVQFGNSIRMWLHYFQYAKVFGIDVGQSPEINNPRYSFHSVDQRSAPGLIAVAEKAGKFDIVVDDGCHNADAIKISFETLWPYVQSGGYYIIEDVFALYHPYFKSSVDGPRYITSFVDDVNWSGKSFFGRPDPVENPKLDFHELTIDSVTYRYGLVILQKK